MTIKLISIYLMSFFYIYVGIKHFTSPQWFMKIMPPYLPYHLQLVYLSGFFEILFGLYDSLVPVLFSKWGFCHGYLL